MKYTITFTDESKKIINTHMSIDEVMLLIADTYSDKWYGCCISCENGNFFCNAVKDYYDCVCPNESVYQRAMKMFCNHLKISNGLCVKGYDYKEECETTKPINDPFEEVK